MLRATVWTVGLFGAGTAISRLFPGTWTEPLVLLALGVALLFVSARTARSTTGTAEAALDGARAPHAPAAAKRAAVPAKPAAVAAAVQGAAVQVDAVQVERTA
jgi:hypothetical protein